MKYLIIIFIALLSSKVFSGDYIGKSGKFETIRFATYWGGYSCIKLDDTWFHFKYDESGIDYLKSMILAAKASNAEVTIGSNTSSQTSVCGNLTSFSIVAFEYK